MIKRVLPLALLFMAACAPNLEKLGVPQKMEIANDYYQRGRYTRAAEVYKSVVFERYSQDTPTAQARLADCYFRDQKWPEALFEYQELIRLFPDSPDAAQAYYNIGVCYFNESLPAAYTQEETVQGIDAFKSFKDHYPGDTRITAADSMITTLNYKLLTKKLQNGITYYRMDDYPAAIMYFEELIARQASDDLDCQSAYYSALIYIFQKDKNNAAAMLQALSQRHPQAPETAKIRKKFLAAFPQ